MSLEQIGQKHETDKVTHKFLPFYESFMAVNRNKPVKFLEIGVFYGASVKMWAEYFTNDATKIVGADWFEGKNGNGHTFPNSTYILTQPVSPKIEFVKMDQSNYDNLCEFANSQKEYTYDYILDDGSHLMKDQQTTFIKLFSLLKNGGVFIIEDLHTSFQNGYDVDKCKMTTYEMVESIIKGKYPELAYLTLPIEIFNSISSAQLFKSETGSLTCCIVRK